MCSVILEVLECLDTNKKCIPVFLDLAKAFDTVNHARLVKILERAGIRGLVLDIFRSYLTDTLQYVRIDDTLSNPETIKIGVPEGIVLGPILFLLYINSLLSLITDIKIVAYADDKVVTFKGETWEETKVAVQMGMKKIKHWLDFNYLSLNVSKTHYLAYALSDTNKPGYVVSRFRV